MERKNWLRNKIVVGLLVGLAVECVAVGMCVTSSPSLLATIIVGLTSFFGGYGFFAFLFDLANYRASRDLESE